MGSALLLIAADLDLGLTQNTYEMIVRRLRVILCKLQGRLRGKGLGLKADRAWRAIQWPEGHFSLQYCSLR